MALAELIHMGQRSTTGQLAMDSLLPRPAGSILLHIRPQVPLLQCARVPQTADQQTRSIVPNLSGSLGQPPLLRGTLKREPFAVGGFFILRVVHPTTGCADHRHTPQY